jgi:hypothetical protein
MLHVEDHPPVPGSLQGTILAEVSGALSPPRTRSDKGRDGDKARGLGLGLVFAWGTRRCSCLRALFAGALGRALFVVAAVLGRSSQKTEDNANPRANDVRADADGTSSGLNQTRTAGREKPLEQQQRQFVPFSLLRLRAKLYERFAGRAVRARGRVGERRTRC